MRVLVTSTPGSGHIHPVVPLAQAVQDAGHEVLWATATESCARVEGYGFRTVPAGLSTTERRARFLAKQPDVFSLPPRERRLALMPGLFGFSAAPHMREELAPIVDDYRPDVVIHEVAEFAAPLLARRRDIPHVAVAFGGTLSNELHDAIVESVADLWAAEGLTVPPTSWLYDDLYLHPYPPALGPPPSAHTARRMRPLNYDGASLRDVPPWIVALGADRPAVYATFGTDPLAPAPWRELLDALAMTDVDAVATLGAVDASAVGPIPDNVRVESYVPQAFVLDHVRVVVSHGGAGTVLGAAAHGVPQLCLPLAADQWSNADAIAGSGAAITLELDQRDAPTIRAALQRLLIDSSFAEAATRLAADIQRLPHPSEHVAAIEALA